MYSLEVRNITVSAPTGAIIPILCRARAVADFEATAANQLSLRTGDVVCVREKSSTGWWEGELVRDEHTYAGWFPGDYVTPISVSGLISFSSF